MSETKEYITKDRKAENGITINNILLSVLILGGGIFGTLINGYLTHLTASVTSMELAVSSLQAVGSVTSNELSHINSKIAGCKEFHVNIEQRLRTLENKQ